jgi:uncharacterized protein
MSATETSAPAIRMACPECGKTVKATSKPFCSERCRNVDLHRWLSGAYAIPAVEQDDSPEAQDGRDGN